MHILRKTVRMQGLILRDLLIPGYKEYNEADVTPIRRGEVLRYSGIPAEVLRRQGLGRFDESYLGEESDELTKLLDDIIKLAGNSFTYRVAYSVVPISWNAGKVLLPFEQESEDLAKNLEGCSKAVIFAATVGAGIDMLIRRYERTDSIRGLLLQGLGAERAEALCDTFNREISITAEEEGLTAKPRYSPGFGDLPITVQPDVLKLVNAEKRLGITLNASYLMSPSKSVTAIIGLNE